MKSFLALGMSAIAYAAHMAETCEVVMVKGKGGTPVRINKSDYDADPGAFTLHKDEPVQTVEGSSLGGLPENVQQKPAPSAPDFNASNGEAPATPLPIDPATGAAMPTVPAADQFLVVKDGRKFYVATKAGEDYPRVTGVTGIDEGGYKTDAEAWQAVEAARAINRLIPGAPAVG